MPVRRSALSSVILGLALAFTTTAATAALEAGEWFDGLEAGVCFDDVFDADGNFDFSVAPPIVPCEGVHGDVSDIWVMSVDGTEATPLTDDAGNDYDPRWSPDGSQMLFTSDRAGNYDIWVMNADGSDPRPLTSHPANDEYPAWSPDGELVAFHSDRHGGKTLWLMRPDGSEQSQLSGHAPLGYPAFRPASD